MATDHFWNATFEEIFEAFSWDTKSKLSFAIDADVIDNLEKIRKANRANGLTFKDARTPEFIDCIDQQLMPLFQDVLARYDLLTEQNLLQVLEAASLGFHNDTLGRSLGLSRLLVEPYVLMVTADKPLTGNDYIDWAHAGAALPNCDVFVTESFLAHQLTKVLRADKIYGCDVVTGAAATTKLLTDRFL
jgi:hypothetical protein